MQSLSFVPGRALLVADSVTAPWTVVFEDEGVAGYLYARDRSEPEEDRSILDAMLLYNVGALRDPATERLAAVEWSRDGLQAVFYLDGTAQAMVDFAQRRGSCRSDFPNFLEESGAPWRRTTHAWDEAAVAAFEAKLYA